MRVIDPYKIILKHKIQFKIKPFRTQNSKFKHCKNCTGPDLQLPNALINKYVLTWCQDDAYVGIV